MSQCITHYAKYLQLLTYKDFEHNCKYVINIMYSRAHKLFGHSRVFILTIMIYVKRIIFSNDCISKRWKDRMLKLF